MEARGSCQLPSVLMLMKHDVHLSESINALSHDNTIHLPSIKRRTSSLPTFRFISTAFGKQLYRTGGTEQRTMADLIMGPGRAHVPAKNIRYYMVDRL